MTWYPTFHQKGSAAPSSSPSAAPHPPLYNHSTSSSPRLSSSTPKCQNESQVYQGNVQGSKKKKKCDQKRLLWTNPASALPLLLKRIELYAHVRLTGIITYWQCWIWDFLRLLFCLHAIKSSILGSTSSFYSVDLFLFNHLLFTNPAISTHERYAVVTIHVVYTCRIIR